MAKQVYTTGQILTAAQMTTLQANDFNQTVSAKVASYTLVAADAGTRITMSNAGATAVTVNTAIFTAGDTLEITNIGAGICTVTAGTATVSTSSTLALKQFDSGQLYFTSPGVAIFFASDAADSPLTTKGDLFTFTTVDARLAVGATNGMLLTVDSAEATGLKYALPATPTFAGVKCKSTVSQTISNNTSTALNWDSEDYDTNTYHSTSSNTSRITIPSGKNGYYLIGGYVTSDSQTSGFIELQIAKNGSAVASFTITPSNQLPSISAQTVVSLVATDYVELFYKQNSGGNKQAYINSIYGDFTANLLGG